jgi:AcrR family transcriptional regulator
VTKEEVLKNYRVGEILEATRRTIGRFGYEGCTVDRVAEEARIAKGTIYLYFPNKDEMLHSAVVEGLRALTKELRTSDNVAAPPMDRLLKLVKEMFRIQRAHEDFVKALILDSRFVSYEPGDRREEELRKVFLDMLNHIVTIIEAAIKQGVVRAIDPHLAAFMLSEMTSAALKRRLLGMNGEPAAAEEQTVLELFLYGVRGVIPERSDR